MRDWVNSFKDKRDGLAVFSDTTMLYSCRRTIDERYTPSPLALFDLGTLVRSVILYDHVVHFRGGIPSEEWNERLGDRVFLPIDRGVTSSRDADVHPIGYALSVIVLDVLRKMNLARKKEGDVLAHDELDHARQLWSALLNRTVTNDDLIGDCLDNTIFLGHSPTADVFLDWTRISALDMQKLTSSDNPKDSTFVRSVISDANHRSLINSRVATVLQIPYASSVLRAPFRNLDHKRYLMCEEQVRSVEIIQKAVRRRRQEEVTTLELPVFLSALLGRITSLEHFWDELAELRLEAGPFRRRRRELEYLLADIGSKYESRARGQLAKAVLRESQGLISRLRVPVVGATAATVAAALSGPAAAALTAIAMLSVWEKIDSETYSILIARFRRPYESFLSHLGEEAAAMLSGLPRVARLWRIPESDLNAHAAFLERARSIGYI